MSFNFQVYKIEINSKRSGIIRACVNIKYAKLLYKLYKLKVSSNITIIDL